MHSIKKAGLLDFWQDGRLGVVSRHIINVFLVGFCRREREGQGEAWGWELGGVGFGGAKYFSFYSPGPALRGNEIAKFI